MSGSALIVFLAATESESSGQAAGTIIAAVIAAVAAIISAAASVWTKVAQTNNERQMQVDQQKHEHELRMIAQDFSSYQREIEYRTKQLLEFYGPLRVLRGASKSLRSKLPPEVDGVRWRLVDHIQEVRDGDDPVQRAAVEQILDINEKIEDILETKGGLAETWHASFMTFVSHSRLLRLAWQQGSNKAAAAIPFPDLLDDDVERGNRVVQAALDRARQLPETDSVSTDEP